MRPKDLKHPVVQWCEMGQAGQVQGCGHPVVGSIVNGSFIRNGENHGKPTYKKTEQVPKQN